MSADILELEDHIKFLGKSLSAAKLIIKSQEEMIRRDTEYHDKCKEALSTMDSLNEANSILTNEIDVLEKEILRLKALLNAEYFGKVS